MIKVELFYKVSMFGSDWMVSADEFEEMRKEFLEIPDYVPIQRKKSYSFPENINAEWNAIEEKQTAWAEDLRNRPIEKEQKDPEQEKNKITPLPPAESRKQPTEECPELIKIEEKEKPQEKPTKEKEIEDPYQKYVEMLNFGHQKTAITRAMAKDLNIASTTANQYYYSKIKPLADAQSDARVEAKLKSYSDKEENAKLEKEKKDLLKEITNETNSKQKIEVIPEVKPQQPKEGKHFTDEFKQKILKQSSGSFWGR